MRSRSALTALALSLTAITLIGDASPATAAVHPPAALLDAGSAHLLGLVNRERAAAGLRPLVLRDDISNIARAHSLDMAARRDIWHNDAYFTRGTRTRLAAKGLGENVAVNGTLEDAHRRLMASPPHRANILNATFDGIGIAVATDGVSLYITENFVRSGTKVAGRSRTGRVSRPQVRRPPHRHARPARAARR